MGVQTRIITYAPDAKVAETAAARAFARIGQLDAILSDYRQDSELMRLCKTSRTWVPISPDLLRILRDGRVISDATGGAFDITIGAATRQWRMSRQSGRLPDPALLEITRGLTDYRAVELDIQASAARLTKPGLMLDAGGIAKCDAAQQARDQLAADGLTRSLVALAGDIAVGEAPPGEPGWHVAFESPPQNPPRFLVVRNTCVSTSGDTEQFVEIEGKRYAHIVDPRTCVGTPGGIRVTVVHPRGSYADALATAICVTREDPAASLAKTFDAALAIQITTNGETHTTIVDPKHALVISTEATKPAAPARNAAGSPPPASTR